MRDVKLLHLLYNKIVENENRMHAGRLHRTVQISLQSLAKLLVKSSFDDLK